MGIDWFTFVAQIINFIILILLLQRFLYTPIIRVMNQRKQKIKASLLEAEDKIIKAEQEASHYRDLTNKLEQEKTDILNQAKIEAEQEKTVLIKEIREKIEQNKIQWYQTIEQEKERFLHDLKLRTSKEIYNLLLVTLIELADIQLEQQIINVFLEKLKQLDINLNRKISPKLQETQEEISIHTAFEINNLQKEEITKTIQVQLSTDAKINFKVIPDLICGIKLIAVGQEIAWSLESYLQTLEERLNNAFFLT